MKTAQDYPGVLIASIGTLLIFVFVATISFAALADVYVYFQFDTIRTIVLAFLCLVVLSGIVTVTFPKMYKDEVKSKRERVIGILLASFIGIVILVGSNRLAFATAGIFASLSLILIVYALATGRINIKPTS